MSKLEKLTIDKAAECMIDKAREDGVQLAWDRASQQVKCLFGDTGVCCRICLMGPCKISPVKDRGPQAGICGASGDVIVARNLARMIAAGTSAHSDHGRSICYDLLDSGAKKDFKVTDTAKLTSVAKRYNIATKGKTTYKLAHEVAKRALDNFGSPEGKVDFPESLPPQRLQKWKDLGIVPRSIDREIVSLMHSTTIGSAGDAEALLKAGFRTAISDGWLGSSIATELSDILFGTPTARQTEANLGVLEKNQVNIILHGHEPSLSELIVKAADLPEMKELAKSVGAEGINICGMCCTANEVAMRHGVKIAGNFLHQELAIVTGAVEALVVDVQCIFPSIAQLVECYHTKFITTSAKARIKGAMHVELGHSGRFESAKTILRGAILNFKNRKHDKVRIPEHKEQAILGFSIEQIITAIGGKTDTHKNRVAGVKPLVDLIVNGTIKGVVGIVGCNSVKQTQDHNHVEIIQDLIAQDILVLATGCVAQAAAKHKLMQASSKELAGAGLKAVCEQLGIPPVLHLGSCVDISRILEISGLVAQHVGVDIDALPLAGIAPEYMSEKAVTIGCYVVASGIDTWLGSMPPIAGGAEVVEILTNKAVDWLGARFYVEPDPNQLAKQVVERITEKRKALGLK